jgi:glucose-6-phosphate dehydrogenase assembly protein OpcA
MTEVTALGKEVEIGKIASGLREFWDSEDAGTTRASLINFAVYSEREGALERNTGVISELTREHACRALLISARPSEGENSARAWITAHCQLGRDGKKSLCSEQIAFSLQGPASRMVRNIVFAHLESDLPLVLWWQGELSENFESHLYSMIDRLLVDSSEWSDPCSQFRILAAAETENHARFVPHDMSWTRSFYFRRAIAAAFDKSAAQACVDGLREVTVTVREGHRMAAGQLVAWIAVQLGWSHDGLWGFRNGKGESVAVRVLQVAEGPTVAEVEIVGSGIRVSIVRQDGDGRFLRQRLTLGDRESERLLPAGGDSKAQLINIQLMRGGNNSLFRKTLPMFRKMLGC